MAVTRDDVLHVAKLARLDLSHEEVTLFTQQLNGILSHVAELSVADTAAVPPVVSAAEWPAPLRDDLPGADALAFPAVELSPHHEAGFFTVPRLAALDSEVG
ncbi:MAG: Asp-tRNA(Asn)/Glu-tRNA(Gln) amidotransferase subunit GatC [Longimicrobiales bacterium]